MKDSKIEKIYSGILGKLVGIRYGAPVEMWTSSQILEKYGDKDGYLEDYKHFAADDDSNGPIFFLKCLKTFGINPSTKEFGLNWLNYVPYLHGFFWWGGYGVSTEHTAYLNLLNNIDSPLSGSQSLNGITNSNQIGGQIFVDFWGLLSQGDCEVAANYAYKASQVSHDKEALEGAKFVSVLIASAFNESSIINCILKALEYIDKNSDYYKCVMTIVDFHKKDKSVKNCFDLIHKLFWKDKYRGNCHIIPNIAIMIMSLLYGNGDFDKTMKYCNYSGFDTDCNLGNIGCFLGVFLGYEKIDYDKWVKCIRDEIICSSALACYNNVDVSELVYEIVRYSDLIIDNKEVSSKYHNAIYKETPKYSFLLPNTTHGFIREQNKIYKYSYFKSTDYSDDRYQPAVTFLVYPGDNIIFRVSGTGLVRIFVVDLNGNTHYSEYKEVSQNSMVEYIEKDASFLIHIFGIEFNENINIIDVDIKGNSSINYDFSKVIIDEYSLYHKEVIGFSNHYGNFDIEDNQLVVSSYNESKLYTFKESKKDISIETTLMLRVSGSSGLLFKVSGVERCYETIINSESIILYKRKDRSKTTLDKKSLVHDLNKFYTLKVITKDNKITIFEDDVLVIEYVDSDFYQEGCVGLIVSGNCCSSFKNLYIKEDSK